MNTEELRIKIAEMLGWRLFWEQRGVYRIQIVLPPNSRYPWMEYQNSENEKSRYEEITFDQFIRGDCLNMKILPDYPNSIEAAMQLEDMLPEEKRTSYVLHLLKLAATPGYKYGDLPSITEFFLFTHASPEQRCRAWVEVMEAK